MHFFPSREGAFWSQRSVLTELRAQAMPRHSGTELRQNASIRPKSALAAKKVHNSPYALLPKKIGREKQPVVSGCAPANRNEEDGVGSSRGPMGDRKSEANPITVKANQAVWTSSLVIPDLLRHIARDAGFQPDHFRGIAGAHVQLSPRFYDAVSWSSTPLVGPKNYLPPMLPRSPLQETLRLTAGMLRYGPYPEGTAKDVVKRELLLNLVQISEATLREQYCSSHARSRISFASTSAHREVAAGQNAVLSGTPEAVLLRTMMRVGVVLKIPFQEISFFRRDEVYLPLRGEIFDDGEEGVLDPRRFRSPTPLYIVVAGVPYKPTGDVLKHYQALQAVLQASVDRIMDWATLHECAINNAAKLTTETVRAPRPEELDHSVLCAEYWWRKWQVTVQQGLVIDEIWKTTVLPAFSSREFEILAQAADMRAA